MQYLRIHFISSFKGNCLNNQEQGGYKKGDPSGKHTCNYFCEDFNGIVGVGKLRAIRMYLLGNQDREFNNHPFSHTYIPECTAYTYSSQFWTENNKLSKSFIAQKS